MESGHQKRKENIIPHRLLENSPCILQRIQNFCAVKFFPISVEITAQGFKIGYISDLLKQHCHYQNILNVLSVSVPRDIFIHLSRQCATALTFEMHSSSGSKSLFPSVGDIVMEKTKQTKKETNSWLL